ncbi:MAG: methyltransferase domain-containing protein [Candidatus Scalindua sp.]|nr:methyltransferase domain-containing protein [Candidatus Scalindua sp.]
MTIGYVHASGLDDINQYLGHVKASIDYAIGPMVGCKVLDVGCGPASDTLRLSPLVGASGYVIGVDSDSEMVDEANSRLAGCKNFINVEHIVDNVSSLRFSDNCFDIVRCERVLQHIDNPSTAIREMHRVLRPGGRLVIADTDHASLCIDTDFIETERAFCLFRTRQFANGLAGRKLYRWFVQAGLNDVKVGACSSVTTSLEVAIKKRLFLNEVDKLAVKQGAVSATDMANFLANLRDRHEAGQFCMSSQIFIVSGNKNEIE